MCKIKSKMMCLGYQLVEIMETTSCNCMTFMQRLSLYSVLTGIAVCEISTQISKSINYYPASIKPQSQKKRKFSLKVTCASCIPRFHKSQTVQLRLFTLSISHSLTRPRPPGTSEGLPQLVASESHETC